MILVDTSIWINHIAQGNPTLQALLGRREASIHPFVIGEIALGSLARRDEVLEILNKLPRISMASHEEVMLFLDKERLFGRGIGYVDSHLLAATRLSPGTRLWTRDKRLANVCLDLKVAAFPSDTLN